MARLGLIAEEGNSAGEKKDLSSVMKKELGR